MKNSDSNTISPACFETPESAISSLLRTLNAHEHLNRLYRIKGYITKITPVGNATFATLSGNSDNAVVRLYTSSREGNQGLLDNIWPDSEYIVTGYLTVYNNAGQVNVQLIPVSIQLPQNEQSTPIQDKKSDSFIQLIPKIVERRSKGLDVSRAIENAVVSGRSVKFALVFPLSSEENARKDILAGLGNVANRFCIEPYPCNFTQPGEISGTLMRADAAIADFVVFSRGGGQNLHIIDDKNILDTLIGMKKPVLAGLGHAVNNHLADIIVEKSCSVPFHVGSYLRETYLKVRQEQDNAIYRRTELTPRMQKDVNQLKKMLEGEPTFYNIRWTDKKPVKYTIYALMLIGLLQILSFFM